MNESPTNHRPRLRNTGPIPRPAPNPEASGLAMNGPNPILSADEPIHVAAGGPLVVPREDIDADIDEGSELDLGSKLALMIRKPDRREWIALHPDLELSTRLLVHKTRPDTFDVEYFHVDASLRGPIQDELKRVRVFPYYSFATGAFALWIVRVTLGNS